MLGEYVLTTAIGGVSLTVLIGALALWYLVTVWFTNDFVDNRTMYWWATGAVMLAVIVLGLQALFELMQPLVAAFIAFALLLFAFGVTFVELRHRPGARRESAITAALGGSK